MRQAGEERRIGPGRVVLVVGPSGAGKDSVIRAARERLAGDARYVFPRRTITRPPSPSEDNVGCDEAAFARCAAEGGFAVSWQAHGLSYAVPVSIDAAIRDGRTVVCNVSRTTLPAFAERYQNLLVVEITAPPDILAERLAARGRTQDGDVAGRIRRSADIGRVRPDVAIANTGPLARACDAFVAALDRET